MRKDLSTAERNLIVQFLLQHLKNGKPARGKMQEASLKFNCCRHTVGRIWAAAKEQQNQGQLIHLQSKKKGAIHRKVVSINLPLIESLGVQKRGTVRKLAKGISCSKTTEIGKIIPAIKAKWPPMLEKLIFIQQDNARPHIKDTDTDFRAAASEDGFDIRLVHQPPNSPDTNVNDLGWFRAIQSIQIESDCVTVDDLVSAVCCSFAELSPMTLNKVFLSLQGCMVEIMKVKGSNSYKIPHMRKDALLRTNELPRDLEVSADLVRECFTYMMENGMVADVAELRGRLGV